MHISGYVGTYAKPIIRSLSTANHSARLIESDSFRSQHACVNRNDTSSAALIDITKNAVIPQKTTPLETHVTSQGNVTNLYSLFERTAHHKPKRPALEIGPHKLTYEELNGRARRVAAAILSGTCDSPVVAFMAHKSVEAYVAVLGILAAGKGYVPLQPGFPVERTTRMLALSGADTLVVAPEAAGKVTDVLRGVDRAIRVIPIGFTDLAQFRASCGDREIVEVDNAECTASAEPSSIAYLLFTSGSTGLPKGVPIRHSNAMSYFSYVLNRYDLRDNDRFSQTFDLTFDLSVHDLFLCWAVGACLCPLTNTALLAPAKFIRDKRLTVWFSVPSVAMVMHRLRQLGPGAFPDLRVSLFCGEALSASLAAAWQAAAPNSIVENLYGPTEATIAISHYRWMPGDEGRQFPNGVVPIGTIFASQSGCIRGEDGRLAPGGQTGELCLGGSQLTAGYWNNPEQTARAFVTIPGSGEDRWYRTGDVARVGDDGILVYLGRIDNQVQVMGYRVELQEVEHALREAVGTEMAVAIPWPIEGGRADAIYGVCSGGEITDAQTAKQRCAGKLPNYMVPSDVFWIADMPVNANGKIDRLTVAKWVKETISAGESRTDTAISDR
jgi:amino acid adenylation domain-containing protein